MTTITFKPPAENTPRKTSPLAGARSRKAARGCGPGSAARKESAAARDRARRASRVASAVRAAAGRAAATHLAGDAALEARTGGGRAASRTSPQPAW